MVVGGVVVLLLVYLVELLVHPLGEGVPSAAVAYLNGIAGAAPVDAVCT